MRRIAALVVLAALAAAPAALAKERNLSMIGAPAAPKAGQAWNARISVTIDKRAVAGKAPTLRVLSAAGRAIDFKARATAKRGVYTARVVFPKAGMWRVVVVEGETGRGYSFGRMKVLAA